MTKGQTSFAEPSSLRFISWFVVPGLVVVVAIGLICFAIKEHEREMIYRSTYVRLLAECRRVEIEAKCISLANEAAWIEARRAP